MKKWIRRGAALCAAVLLAVTGTIGCLAAVTEKETTVVVEEMDLEVTVPAGYHVLTPDMSENDGAFLLAGITDPAGALADVACVILAEGVQLEPSVAQTAQMKGVNILSAELTAYEAALLLGSKL